MRRFAIDRRQFVAGLLFGLACTARLTVVFGAPFFALRRWRGPAGGGRAWSAGLGAALPIVGLLAYNVVSTGQLFSPAYDYLYRLETAGYPALGYHADWGIEDVRATCSRTSAIGLFGRPDVLPAHLPDALGRTPVRVCTDPTAVRGLFDVGCPLAVPRDIGMSVLLTSPAYLLAIPVLGRVRRNRLVAGRVIAVVAIAIVNLMHFSQGWVQFGYRFSNDAARSRCSSSRSGSSDWPFAADGACFSPWAWSSRRPRSTCGASSGVGRWDGEPIAGWPPRWSVALIAFVAAVLTMLPGVAYWDTGELQAVAPLLGTAHPTGFPTYVLLGWLASVAPPAVRRAGLPDEPAVRPVPGRGGRLHGRPRAGDLPVGWRSGSRPASGWP